MKTIIHIALLCLTSIAFSQEQLDVKEKSISTELTFGRLGQDCRGRGICSFKITSNKTPANTQIRYRKDNNVTFIINRSLITKEAEYKIVEQYLKENSKIKESTFVLEDDFILENQLKSELKIPQQITKIAKGNYRVLISEDTFTITFKLE